MYWIRAIQHFGSERLQPESSDALTNCCIRCWILRRRWIRDFIVAYRFGAIFLSEPHPGGAGRPDLAVALLEKGHSCRAGSGGDYYHDVGFVYYWNLHDYQAARPSGSSGARPAGRAMVAEDVRRGHAHARRRSAGVAASCGSSCCDRRERMAAADGAAALIAARRHGSNRHARADREGVRARHRQAARDRGNSLWTSGLLRGIPVDPTGTPYTLNFADGDVSVAAWSKLYPLPDEPAAAPEAGPHRHSH